jgi:hypothetical protein
MKWIASLAAVGAALCYAGPAHATPYPTPAEIRAIAQTCESWVAPTSQGFLRWESRDYDYLLEFERVVSFITSLQVTDPGGPEYGGLREAEHMLNEVQTDNTAQLIWVLSSYRQMTGDTRFDDNIQAAWTYVLNFPAYDEEGGSSATSGFYRIYNCAWALRADLKYLEVFGDSSYVDYADSCASYLCHHTLRVTGHPFQGIVNPTVPAWAAGNLYAYGLERGSPAFVEKGIQRGGKSKIGRTRTRLFWARRPG